MFGTYSILQPGSNGMPAYFKKELYKTAYFIAHFCVYFANETVAQLVDLAFLVRQDMVTKAGDPFLPFCSLHSVITTLLRGLV